MRGEKKRRGTKKLRVIFFPLEVKVQLCLEDGSEEEGLCLCWS